MFWKIFFVIAAVGLVFFIFKPAREASPISEIKIGGAKLNIQLADTPEKHRLGLSGRTTLGENEGLLFVFNAVGTPGFWMKDMNFPIDIIWVSQNGSIAGITENIPLESFPKTFSSPSPILYVIEVNAGWAARNNIRVGDTVKF